MHETRKKLPLGELAFLLGTVLSAAGIALQTKAALGISMVAAPAYLLSLRIPGLSFGMGECLVQGLLFTVCCLWTGRFQTRALWSFAVAVPYGWVLDRMMNLLAWVAPSALRARLGVFLLGTVTVALGIALFFRSYLPCQMYEMFVKCLSEHLGRPAGKVKLCYDWSSFTAALVLSLVFFRRIEGIGLGTLLCTVLNAPLIGAFGKWLDKRFDFRAALPGLEKVFR